MHDAGETSSLHSSAGQNRAADTGLSIMMYKCTCSWTYRCRGALKELLQAAVVAEEVQIQRPAGTNGLLAALAPAAGTLRTLDAAIMSDDVVCPQPINEADDDTKSADDMWKCS